MDFCECHHHLTYLEWRYYQDRLELQVKKSSRCVLLPLAIDSKCNDYYN